MNKIDLRNISILLILGLIMLLIVNPIGNFPLGDDFVYAQPVLSLLKNGTYKITNVYSAIVIAQVLWGTLFCVPFGFSFTALRISVIVLGFAGTIIFYFLLNNFTGNKKLSLIGALLLLVNPIFFSLSNSFMTDVPFLSFVLFATYFFVKAIKKPELKYILPAVIFSVIATLIRQMGIVIPIAYALTQAIKNKPPLRQWAKYFLPAIVVLAAMGFTILWLNHGGSETPKFSGGPISTLLSKPNVIAFNIFERSSIIFYYCGISLLPLLLFSGYNLFKDYTYHEKIRAGIFIAFFIPCLMFGWSKFPIDDVGNIIDGCSIGPKTLRDAYILHLHDPGHMNTGIRYFLSIIGLTGAVLLLMNMVNLFTQLFQSTGKGKLFEISFQHINLLLFIAGYFLLICLPEKFFDRYFLPLIPVITLLVISIVNPNWHFKRNMFLFSLIYIFLLSSFSSLATHDYLQWNRTRWETANYLTKELNIPAYRIDGGMEYNGWTFEKFFPEDKSRKMFWYAPYNEWMIGFGDTKEYSTVKKFSYANYIPFEQRDIYLLRRISRADGAKDTSAVNPLDASIKNLEQTIKLNPTAENYFNLGTYYLEADRNGDCIEANKKVLDLNPDYVIVYNSMALAYFKLKMWNEVIDEEKKALRIDSSFTGARMNINAAIQMSLLNKDKISTTSYLNQSVQYYNAHKYQDCILICKECLAHDSTSYTAWNNIAISYINLRQYQDAEEAAERALIIKPDFAPALQNLEAAKKCLKK
jgi:Tfp pilus assembly protein PilF/4-amino-4-deoxy-L-arabinose transferase-like glycosyltransferase